MHQWYQSTVFSALVIGFPRLTLNGRNVISRKLKNMAPSFFQDSNENKMWLWQKGSVKEFNAFFDDATSNVQLPERYLVMTYVAGLKREIADSVLLFQPRTMREACSIARAEEIAIQWRAKQAIKELEDQEEGLAAQESDGSGSFNTQECFANQEASANQEQEVSTSSSKVSLPLQDSVAALGDEPENHKADQVVRTSVTKAPTSVAGVLVQKVSLLTNRTGEAKTSSGDFYLGCLTSDLVSDFRNLKTWKCPKTGEGVDESSHFKTLGNFLIVSHAGPSCAALSVSTLSTSIPILPSSSSSLAEVSVSFPPLSYLPSSLSMLTPTALGCFLPLSLSSSPAIFFLFLPWSPLASSLFEFDVIAPILDFSPVEKNSGASKKNMFEGAEWQDLGCTWLGLVQVEKSNLQLSPNFIHWLYECLGFKFHSPISLQLGLVSPLGQDLNRLLLAFLLCSPTGVLLQIWFKGELIKMLIGSGFLQYTVDNNWGSVTYEKGSK